jgi:hypothetical protein
VIRVEFHHYGGQTNVFAATIFGGAATIRTLQTVALTAPMYLRVGRNGDLWTVQYSLDGATWTTATSFTQAMTVGAVGVFAGNGADTAHTAVVDYFRNTAAGKAASSVADWPSARRSSKERVEKRSQWRRTREND